MRGEPMKISEQERRNVWLSFASAVVSTSDFLEEAIDEDHVNDIVEVADEMLDAYLSRFDEGHAEEEDEPAPRKRRKR
jgi:hypothetical protein